MSSQNFAGHELKFDNYLPYLLSIASNAVSTVVSRAYHTRFGLTIPQWRLVAVLAETEGLTQQALCDRTFMDKVTVSRAAHGLVTRELISRSPHSQDGRSHLLMLTAEGRRLFNEVAPTALAMERALFETFSGQEKEMFAALLSRVRTRAQELIDKQNGDEGVAR